MHCNQCNQPSGDQGGAECPTDSEKIAKNREKMGGRGKEERAGRKGQNREGSFTLPLLKDSLATLLIATCNNGYSNE